MNESLVRLIGNGKRDSLPGKNVRVESLLHSEAWTEKTQPTQPQRFRRRTRGLNNADQWNR
jgi:hypothetical protein